MKHIFINHSNVTRLQIDALIKKLGLRAQDYYVISFRNNVGSTDWATIELKHPYDNKSYHHLTKREFRQTIASIDKLLTAELNRTKFKLYAPNYSKFIVQLLATHKNCIQTNLIEDGMGNYHTKDELLRLYRPQRSFFKEILFRRKYGFRVGRMGFIPKKISNTYTMHEKAMPGFKSIVIKDDIKQSFSALKVDIDIKSRDAIFVFDALFEFNKASLDDMLNGLMSFSENVFAKLNYDRPLFVKFHPEQKKNTRAKIVDFMNSKNIRHTIIDDDVILEALFVKFNFSYVAGYVSSLLFYASILGQSKVYSYVKYLNGYNINNLSQAFLDEVKVIEI